MNKKKDQITKDNQSTTIEHKEINGRKLRETFSTTGSPLVFEVTFPSSVSLCKQTWHARLTIYRARARRGRY